MRAEAYREALLRKARAWASRAGGNDGEECLPSLEETRYPTNNSRKKNVGTRISVHLMGRQGHAKKRKPLPIVTSGREEKRGQGEKKAKEKAGGGGTTTSSVCRKRGR